MPLLHATLLLGLPGAGAQAEPIEWSFGVASATVLRGVALGVGGVDAHAAADYAHPGGWRATLGAAALHSKPSREQRWQAQYFARLGYAHRVEGDWSAQLALAHHDYPGSEQLRRYATDELGAAFAYRDLFYFSVAALRRTHAQGGGSINGSARDSVAYDLVVRHALPAALSANVGLGHLETRGGPRHAYTYGHLGLGARWGDTQAQLAWITTGGAAKRRYGDAASNRWTASLDWRF